MREDLETRLKEHVKSVQDGDYKSALSQHNLESGYQVDFESVKVVQQIAQLRDRKIAESIHIRLKRPALNRDCDYDLPRVYDQVLRRGDQSRSSRTSVVSHDRSCDTIADDGH